MTGLYFYYDIERFLTIKSSRHGQETDFLLCQVVEGGKRIVEHFIEWYLGVKYSSIKFLDASASL